MTENGKNIVLKRHNLIVKGGQDSREYRGLELTNGVRVLLVSDPTTDKSAAALDVKVGHLMDPWELPGLAHFCEHMLFLGTAKYPSENEYSKFLAAHAGSSNAFTSTDHTNYHFDVKPEQLPGALDRFVQFFLAPQFTETATEREVCAVDSEHSNNLNNDMWRLLQVDRSRSRPGHDYGKFGTGNKQTLLVDARKKGIEPRDALLQFHKKWYSSDIMSCCIIGRESLDELEGYLGTLGFDAIENKKVARQVWSEYPYGPEQLGKKVEVVPIKDTRLLTLSFPFPDLNGEYETQPGHYITHLLGHEGTGSLLSELKRLGWVSSLQAGNHTQAAGFGVFDVTMDLSTEGLDHVDDIVQLVFNYIGLLQRSGPQQWIQDELAELSAVKFRFKDKETPINMATSVAATLQYIPFENILSSKYLLTKFEPERIKELLATLTPANMSYRVVSQKFKGQEGNTTEPVYGTEIRVTDIDKTTFNKFEQALKTEHPALHLPEKNKFIATNFEQKARESVKSEHPRLISDDGWSRVWFKQDDEYKMPKQETKMALTTPMVAQNPRTSLISSLWLWCLSDTLTEETYNADLAGLKCQLESSAFGVQLRVHGYDEKQALFVKHITNRMTNFKIDRTRFDVLFESLKRALTNHAFSQPYSLTQHYSQLVLLDKAWSKEQLLAVCDSVKLEDVQEFAKDMLKAFHLELFVHGNSTEKEALELSRELTSILKTVAPNSRPLFRNEHTPRRELQLENGSEYLYRHLQKTHDVGCVEVMYQIGVENNYDNAVIGLVDQLIREPAFNTLRTTEALGYIVWTGSRHSAGTISLNIIVQGPKSVDHVLERIEAFLESVHKEIVDMPQDEFDKQIAGMISRLEEKPKTLSGRFRRFWNEIECRQYNFARREDEVKVLKTIKKDDVLKIWKQKIAKGAEERRKLAVFVHGKNEGKSVVDEIIKKNITDGKKEQEVQYTDQLRQFLPLYGRPKAAIPLKPIGVDPLEHREPETKSKY
uniref:Insulin-degrading enzyme n=1 Tax=Caenorhabditis japonica TaxID=281687 RepID=A0A8R1HQ00_CAEJA